MLRSGIHGAGLVSAMSGGGAHGTYADKVLSHGPSAYWPLWEAGGVIAACLVNAAQDGTYSSDVSGWPVGAGIGDGNTAPTFDGTNDFVDIYSATFNSALDRDVGTIHLWGFPDNWADANVKYFYDLRIDANNWLDTRKNGANQIRFTANCGGAFNSYIYAVPADERIIWLPIAMTWEWGGVNTEIKCYVNGSHKNTFNCAGQLVGNLANNTAVIGAASTVPTDPFSGYEAHVAVWDTVLAQDAITDLAST